MEFRFGVSMQDVELIIAIDPASDTMPVGSRGLRAVIE